MLATRPTTDNGTLTTDTEHHVRTDPRSDACALSSALGRLRHGVMTIEANPQPTAGVHHHCCYFLTSLRSTPNRQPPAEVRTVTGAASLRHAASRRLQSRRSGCGISIEPPAMAKVPAHAFRQSSRHTPLCRPPGQNSANHPLSRLPCHGTAACACYIGLKSRAMCVFLLARNRHSSGV